jgi:hypothetical protein
MKISECIDNHVRDYPLWTLILGSVVMILLSIGHVIRCRQSSKRLHHCFAFNLIYLSIQYICAIQDTNTAFLTVIVNFIALWLNVVLFLIWADSMEKYIGNYTVCICFMSFVLSLILGAMISVIFIELNYSSKDSHNSFDLDNRVLKLWNAILITSIVGSSILTLITLLYQCRLSSEECKDKRQKRLQLARLSLLSSLLSMSMFGSLFEVPLLYIIPFLLFHAIPILKRDSISSYFHEPDDSIV